jgi:biopolymer transport protein ExbB/TolQ
MNTLTINTRLLCALIAAATTLGLLGTVVSIAEPQRSVLMARNQPARQLLAAPVAVAMASNGVKHEGQ